MKRFAIHAVLTLALLGTAAFLGAMAGLVPVAASSGHWDVTAWLLHTTMRRSVDLRAAAGGHTPNLDDIALVQRGAGHFHTGCAPCHGAPGLAQSPVILAMTPRPPYLPPRIREWETPELHWIVRHGIKFSGMPAWPTGHRDDEVWSIVAFLLRLPGMEAEEYRRHALGPAAGLEQAGASGGASRPMGLGEGVAAQLRNCARCHGLDGHGRGTGAAPILAGQSAEYLLASLRAYAAGERHSGIMQAQAKGLGEETMRALARHYASATPHGRAAAGNRQDGAVLVSHDPGQADGEWLALGRRIAVQGIPRAGVPACASCHGPAAHVRNALYPKLAGQHRSYLVTQLHLWRAHRRGGTAFARLMSAAARPLTDRHIEAVATYYASLPVGGSE